VGKRIAWIAFALGLALYGIIARPLVLGLDLKGGVTMRYELDAPETALLTDDLSAMIDATVETLRTRINAYGIRESSITRQGEQEIVIELPGSSKDEADSIQSLVSRVGRLEFRIIMRTTGEDDDARNQLVVANELTRLIDYLATDDVAGRLPGDLNLSTLDVDVPGGPLYRWYAFSDEIIATRRAVDLTDGGSIEAALETLPLGAGDFGLVKVERNTGNNFTGGDVSGTRQDQDRKGGAAVGVSIRPDRASAFGDWTEPNIGKMMGILLDGRLAQDPAVIQARLTDYFVITSAKAAGFSPNEIQEYLTVIKSGSLQMKPRLLYKNSVGPSLGESSIQAGMTASITGFVAVILFMALYYRANGIIAATCLILNMTLVTGVLMFLGATLTLPGIAGLVLTLGMAVDANILVFERMREESDRAKSVSQAVKLGYEKATSTILDANITTFVTAAILYNVGTGPVRGFAVILMLGIVASLFSVLVFGRLIYDVLVEKGFSSTAMARLIRKDPNVQFMRSARKVMMVSAVAVIVSLAMFFVADRDKYGLDFLGGYKGHVRLLETASQADVKERLAGTLFEGAQVISVDSETASAGGGSDQFVIKLKSAAEDDAADLEETYERPLSAALAGLIRPAFVSNVQLSEDAASASTTISANLTFEATAEADAVAGLLPFLSDVSVTPAADGTLALTGTWPAVELDEQLALQRIRLALVNGEGLPPASRAFLESTMIGSAVGIELRDSALQAILLSFVAIVLYIRVRFREYRYGFAAILALAHDVSITLGIVSVMHFSGIVDVEIDLAMIAAFLTIIGYSLNDTIVLFDRIRENVPRLTGKTYEEVLNISINQTLARTLLTSITTLLVLVIIFAFNYGRQNVLEGFSFAMMIGVLVGTYSSIFVASPALVMLAEKHHGAGSSNASQGGGKATARAASKNAGVPV
jgi:SecD/SecF fusion protein